MPPRLWNIAVRAATTIRTVGVCSIPRRNGFAILRHQPRPRIVPSLIGNDTAIDVQSKPLIVGQPNIQGTLDGQIVGQGLSGLDIQDVGMRMESVRRSEHVNLQRRNGGFVVIVMMRTGHVKVILHRQTIPSITKAEVPNIPIFRQLCPGQMIRRQKVVIGNDKGWWR